MMVKDQILSFSQQRLKRDVLTGGEDGAIQPFIDHRHCRVIIEDNIADVEEYPLNHKSALFLIRLILVQHSMEKRISPLSFHPFPRLYHHLVGDARI